MIIKAFISLYCLLINLLYKISLPISRQTKNSLFMLSIFGLLFLGIIRYCHHSFKAIIHYNDAMAQLVAFFFFFLLLISSITHTVNSKDYKPNNIFWLGWLLCFITMLTMSYVYPVNAAYHMWGILCLTIIPMIIIVWKSRNDYNRLVIIVSRITIIVSFLFLMLNLVIVPFLSKTDALTTADYWGLCNNPNNNGMLCTAFFTAALYLLVVDKQNSFLYLLSLCFSVVISIISVCRTAQLAIIIEFIFSFIFYKKNPSSLRKTWPAKKVLAACMAALFLSIVAGHVLMTIDKYDMRSYATSDYEEAVQWVLSDPSLTKINALSSGRLVIWKAYSSKLGVLGNGSPNGPLMPENSATRWAHNNALDIWYASGLFAFLGYMIWIFSALVFIRNIYKSKAETNPAVLLTVLSFLGYLIQAMLEITIYPTTTGIVFLSYITLGPIAFSNTRISK